MSLPALRLLGEADLPAVLDIERRAYSLPWSETQLRQSLTGEHQVWGLEGDGRLQAYLVSMRVLDELHILNLAVDPALQRRGLASQLFGAVRDAAEGSGARHVFLEVRASNVAAQSLYMKLGFCESGRRRNYYPAIEGREDALLMGMSW